MIIQPEDILKIVLAMALGGMLGAERELRDKDAGLRTLMFISAGAALFTIISLRASVLGDPADPGRIAAQIVSGIGFLGAGVILRQQGQVRGLTTAATIWLAAALGMGVGVGLYFISVAAAFLIMLTLTVFPRIEAMISRKSRTTLYRVTMPASLDKYNALCQTLTSLKLDVHQARRSRKGDDMICTWNVTGRPENHEKLIELLFTDPDVKEFEML